MTEVDIAKLKRLRSAVSSVLATVHEKSAHGLPVTYNALREEVANSVPVGLKGEVERVAPFAEQTDGGGLGVLAGSVQAGARAHAHLAALKGWLDAVIEDK